MDLKQRVLATREAFRKPVEFKPSEWDFPVYIRRLSGGERWGFEASMVKTHINGNIVPDPKKLGEKQVRFVALTLANEDGSRVFSDADLEEVKTLGSRALDELYDFAEKLNATDEEAVEEAKKN